MKFRKPILIAALCLMLAVVVVTIGLKARPSAVHAAAPVPSSHAMSINPLGHLSPAELHAALAPNAMMLDADVPTRVTGRPSKRTIFPAVQEFTLTPPNTTAGMAKTVMSVRFPEVQAANLPASIPMKLANQNVVLQRSPDRPDTFLAALDFNWLLFAEEQAERKAAANAGKMVPIFEGRKYRGIERMQFVEPDEIQQALESHESLQFGSHALVGSAGFNVFPDHQLIMNNLQVVEDVGNGTSQHPARTFDQCLPGSNKGNSSGAWTFNTLMTAIACSNNSNCIDPQSSQQIAESMLLSMFSNFAQDVTVPPNNFTVFKRPPIGQLNGFRQQAGSGLLGNWTVDSAAGTSCTFEGFASPCPSLPNAPVRLDAIVNRIDLEANGDPFPPAGELRFVFSVTASNTSGQGSCSNSGLRVDTFNIILEYNVPSTPFSSALSWAQQWANLPSLNASGSFTEDYLTALQNNITNAVVLKNKCNGVSCISQIRTNEFLLRGDQGVNGAFWEQREFHLGGVAGAPVLTEASIAQTPDPQFNSSGLPGCGSVNNGICTPGIVGQYITQEATDPVFQQTQGAAPPIQQTFNGIPFLGASALNLDGGVAPSFWNDSNIPPGDETTRIDFSFNTCNGCHGRETATNFVHVGNRAAGTPSGLSNFLLGNPQCSIQTENLGASNGLCREAVGDPVNSTMTTLFGDVARRVLFLQNICGNSPTCQPGASNELLLPFNEKPIGVH